MDQKKGYFIYHCLNGEDVCFSLLKLYLDKKFYADFIEHIRMSGFCRHLELSLSQKFKIDVDVYVSKKKKEVKSYVFGKTFFFFLFF